MARRGSRSASISDAIEQQSLLKRRFYFQELPADVQMVVFQGVKFRLSRDYLTEGLGQLDLDDLLHEEADDLINRHNTRRTIKEWLQFAEAGER